VTRGGGLWIIRSWSLAFENEACPVVSSTVLGLGSGGIWSANCRGGSGMLVKLNWSQKCMEEDWRRCRLWSKRMLLGDERIASSRKWSPALLKLIVILDIIATVTNCSICAAIFLVPGGAATIMTVKTKVTINITLLMKREGSKDQCEMNWTWISIPIIQEAIFKESLDDITSFFTADRRYRSIERQAEDYGIVEKRYPCRGRSCVTYCRIENHATSLGKG